MGFFSVFSASNTQGFGTRICTKAKAMRKLLLLLFIAVGCCQAQPPFAGKWVNQQPLHCANGDTAQIWHFDCDTMESNFQHVLYRLPLDSNRLQLQWAFPASTTRVAPPYFNSADSFTSIVINTHPIRYVYKGNIVQQQDGKIIHLDKGMFIKNGRLYLRWPDGRIFDETRKLTKPIKQ